MRRIIQYITFLFLALFACKSYGQRSCVFLPESVESPVVDGSDNRLTTSGDEPSFDRPKVTLHRIHPFSILQTPDFTNAAPDFLNMNVDDSIFTADLDETSIAINPSDPNNLIIGANDFRNDSSLSHFESFDGGRTWSWGSFRSVWSYAGDPTDPAVAFNSSGKAFFSYGRISHDPNPYPINDVVCNTSATGGAEWDLPVRVILDSTGYHLAATLADKYYITVDNISGSPFKNRIYVSWIEYDQARKNRVRLAFSTDDGSSWSQPVYITASGNFQSPIPAVGTSGEVYVAYENIDPAADEIRFARSNDGGKTFSLDKKISNYKELGPFNPPGDSAAHPTIKGMLRVNSFPSIAVDATNAHSGRIYMAWAATGSDNRHHVFLTSSDDTGNSWSVPRAVEGDPSPVKTDKFFPWIAVSDVTGDVGIACYDSRSDSANILTDLYMYFSNDGGQNFIPQRISGNSFDPTVNNSGFSPLFFFGDYNGLAVHNTTWYPAWTDSRSGYVQQIYSAIVRPYAPSIPKNFVALEDSITHLPDLSWEYPGLTTFGAPLGDYVFRLKRLDGGLQIDLPKTARSYHDLQAVKNTNYTYTLQVVTSDGDTSLIQRAFFSSQAIREPLAPLITSAQAQIGGLQITFRMPDKNRAGTKLQNLNRIFYLVDGTVRDSFAVSDGSQGLTKSYNSSGLHPDGYYNIQLAASTVNSDGDTTYSVLSDPKWLYAGSPLPTYSEDFDQSKNIFTPFAWDTTNAGGELPGNFINDSLPDVPYQKNIDTWFLLPPVTMSSDAHTIEFTHIALVAPGDSAIVEISTDDGVSYFYYTSYDKNSHPAEWGNSLAQSKPVYEQLPLKSLIGQNAIIRFRLQTHSSGGDGWFIDSIHFTDALSVPSPNNSSTFRASLSDNPMRISGKAKINLFSDKFVDLSVNIYSMLGNKTETLLSNKPVPAGDYELEFSPDKAGCYFYEVIARSGKGEERRYGKYMVLP